MKILLIIPAFQYKGRYPSYLSFSDFPTGSGYIAGALKKAGHEVYGCNPNNKVGYKSAKEMLTAEIISKIESCKPDLIGLGGICTDYPFIKDAIKIIRETYPTTPIVLGGNIVTNDAEFIFNDLKPDYAVVGEGEEAIVLIVNDRVPKGIVQLPQEYYQSLESRAFPDYEPFDIQDMLDNYSMATRVLYRYPRVNPRVFNLVAARSCPFTCTFCIHGHRQIKYRARSIPDIMNEIKETYEKYKFNILLLLDELFAVNKSRLIDFSSAILEGKEKYGWDFVWSFQTHPSARFDLETLKLAKKAGCYFFSYGIESASPTVLKSMQKKTQVSQITEAIKLAQEAKLAFGGNLIFGDPAETIDTICESLHFWLQNQSEFIFLGFLMPYPGSKIFDDAVAKGLILDKKYFYEHIDDHLINLTSIPNAELHKWFGFLNDLEHEWRLCKSTKMTRCVEIPPDRYTMLQRAKRYRVYAVCPYCNQQIEAEQIFTDITKVGFYGIGCIHCGRKVRINI